MQILHLPLLAPAIAIFALAPATLASRCRGSCGHYHAQHGHHLLSQRHHESQQLLDAVFDHFFDWPSRPTKTTEKGDKQADHAPSTKTSADQHTANKSSLTILSPAFRTYSGDLVHELQLDMPGVSADGLNLEVNSDGSESHNHRILTVTGRRLPSGGYKVQYAERFLMPQDVDEASITAHAADGLVTVTMPKKPAKPPIRIPVTSSRRSTIPDAEAAKPQESPSSVPKPEPELQTTQAEPQLEAASNSEAELPEKEAGGDQHRVMGLFSTPPDVVAGPSTSPTTSEDAGIDDVITLLTEIKNSLDLQRTDAVSDENWTSLINKLKNQASVM